MRLYQCTICTRAYTIIYNLNLLKLCYFRHSQVSNGYWCHDTMPRIQDIDKLFFLNDRGLATHLRFIRVSFSVTNE